MRIKYFEGQMVQLPAKFVLILITLMLLRQGVQRLMTSAEAEAAPAAKILLVEPRSERHWSRSDEPYFIFNTI